MNTKVYKWLESHHSFFKNNPINSLIFLLITLANRGMI